MTYHQKENPAAAPTADGDIEEHSEGTFSAAVGVMQPSKEAARAFLQALDERTTSFTFQTFDDNQDRKDPGLARIFHGSLGQHWESLCDLSAKGAGVFVTINQTDLAGRSEKNIVAVRAVFVDTDGADVTPICAADPHLLVESSPGNYHGYWFVDGCPLDEFRAAQKVMIEAWGTDKGIHDLPRVMRLPGFPHQKVSAKKGLVGTPFMVQIVEDRSEDGVEDWADRKAAIEALAPPPATKALPLSQQALDNIKAAAKPKAKAVTPPTIDEAREILSFIKVDPKTGDYAYDLWLQVLMGLHSVGEDLLWDLAHEWSAEGSGYDPTALDQKWSGFDGNRDGGVTFATVAALAKKKGADLAAIGRRHRVTASKGGAERMDGAEDIDLAQDALAVDLGVRAFDENAKFVVAWGKWLFWQQHRWAIDDHMAATTKTREFLRLRADELMEMAKEKAACADNDNDAAAILSWATRESRNLRSKQNVKAVEELAKSNPASVTGAEAFDGNRMLLGTPGGTVDLRTGAMRDGERADLITKQTTTTPALGTPQRWLAFLDQVMAGDQAKVAFLQRLAGYALTGETTEHKLFFFYGTGRNGKGVFLNTLMSLWGDYARKAAVTTFLSSMGERHPTDIAGLQGARLVFGSELPVGKVWDESVIKDLTGGDRMTARFMRQDFFDFDPQLTLIIAGNNQPSIKGVDEAMRARMVLVPFTVTIPPEQRDPDLQRKLIEEEGPQILQWAIEGAVMWKRDGLGIPASVAEASREYMDDEDVCGQFLKDKTEKDGTAWTSITALHRSFSDWAESVGLNPWSLRTFRKDIVTRGYQPVSRNTGNGFLGIRLKGNTTPVNAVPSFVSRSSG